MIRYRQQIADYARACLHLFWQRQAMLAGGSLMALYSVDLPVVLICYAMCQLGELNDMRVCRAAQDWAGRDGRNPARHVRRMAQSAAVSAGAIAGAMVVVALAEGPSLHLGPLSFLFAAALYATMNHCQVTRLMDTRLAIYGAALLFIPLNDLILVRAPLDSALWMQMLTVVFLLFMLRECALRFGASYRSMRRRLAGLRSERDAVTAACEVQSTFVSIVSHELRSPLTSIKASLDLIARLGRSMPPEEVGRVAGIGRANSDRLAALIDDLLDFQKLGAGKMPFRMEALDLDELAREVIENNRALGDADGIAIAFAAAAAPVRVRGDRDRLQQVLVNVLSNAVKFSRPGASVSVRVEAGDGAGRVLIRDRGIGIPPAARDLVFAPFSQIDAPDRRASVGTGLGMSISRAIMEGHGGTIDFESAPGAGTTFILALDLLPAGPAAPDGSGREAAAPPDAIAVA